MRFGKVLERFVEQSAASVIFRGVLENAVTAELLDRIFRATARRQQERELLFSSLVELLAMVTSGGRRSVHEAYQAHKERFRVSVTSVYNKLQKVEPEVSRQMVRQTALRMAPVVDRLQPRCRAPLPGWRTKILDGTHLAASEHRIEELRHLGAGPLPGFALVVLDRERMLLSDVFPCEDAHAQERTLLGQVLASVEAGDLWIADRNFCTAGFLFGLARRGAAFVIRQHKQNVPWKAVTKRRRIGRSCTGTLYEEKVQIRDEEGNELVLRRITIALDQPTREGECEIHLLTNLSASDASARTVAHLYQDRWTVECAFHELDQALCSQINTNSAGGRRQRAEAGADFGLLFGLRTVGHLPRDDDRRAAGEVELLCGPGAGRTCPAAEVPGREGACTPFPQDHSRPEAPATATPLRQTPAPRGHRPPACWQEKTMSNSLSHTIYRQPIYS